MQSTFKIEKKIQVIRNWVLFFIIILTISGLTAIPVQWELSMASRMIDADSITGKWLQEIFIAVKTTGENYPYLFYGYDWLAFAHLVLAVLFIGPYKDPVKNKWVIEFGAIACLMIIPFALIAGHFRGIPFWWRMIDCSFGILGLLPLAQCHNKILKLEKVFKENQEPVYSF